MRTPWVIRIWPRKHRASLLCLPSVTYRQCSGYQQWIALLRQTTTIQASTLIITVWKSQVLLSLSQNRQWLTWSNRPPLTTLQTPTAMMAYINTTIGTTYWVTVLLFWGRRSQTHMVNTLPNWTNISMLVIALAACRGQAQLICNIRPLHRYGSRIINKRAWPQWA